LGGWAVGPAAAAAAYARPDCSLAYEHTFAYAVGVTELPIPELIENRRRSIAMLPAGAPALNRDEALELLEQLVEALRRLRAGGTG
jgi:hypothetical protein